MDHGPARKPSQTRDQQVIVEHCETYLKEHGDSHLGVGWPKPEQVDVRYQVMLDVIRGPLVPELTLLDFGSGAAHLYEYMLRNERSWPAYSGLDLSPEFIALARRKFPDRVFHHVDILVNPDDVPTFDYVVMNGILTQKFELAHDEMWAYAQKLLKQIFSKARQGLAFNVMSKHLDWERDDLFHLPFDTLARFVRAELSRNYVFRADYGLFEYTTYVYR